MRWVYFVEEYAYDSSSDLSKKITTKQPYQLADWTIEGRYLYRNYSDGPSHYAKQEDVEYVRQGDFFNLNPEGFYLGMDQNEQDFRCSYYGVISVFYGR